MKKLDTQKIVDRSLGKRREQRKLKQSFVYQGYEYVTLYHGTSLDKVPIILEKGLEPTKNIFGPPAVFLTPTKTAARYHARKSAGKKGAILKVVVPKDELKGKDLDLLKKNPISEIKVYYPIHPISIALEEEVEQKRLHQKIKRG